MVDLRWNAIFEGLEALPGMAILGGSSLLQGWKQLEQVALLPQLLQPCPQHLLHPGIKQSQCPTQNPPAAAPAAPWPWSHSCSREHPDAVQGSPEAWSTREPQGLLSLSGGPGLDPRVLLQLPNPCLSPRGASSPPDSQGGQQQGQHSQHGATVTHGSDMAQRHCTGSCSDGDGTELAQHWGQDTV